MNILVNALGIKDSGGLRIFKKLLIELSTDTTNTYYVICNESKAVLSSIAQYSREKNLHFIAIINKGILHRLYYENFHFRKLIDIEDIQLIYNFSGTFQFFTRIPQLIKIQNLLFFSKKLDSIYFFRGHYLLWLKQIFLKRLILNFMLNKSSYIEIQSRHVKDNLSDFLNSRPRDFFIKSDVLVSKNSFHKPKKYDFSKKIKFLYVVGPHFDYDHKNFLDFVNVMTYLNDKGLNFEINVTLTKEQLENSKIWNLSLNSKTNFLGYISDHKKMRDIYCDNSILISTSIIETLGLHVIEAIKNGVIVITPNENYASSVYGKNVFKYELFDYHSLHKTIMIIINYKDSHTNRILSIQDNFRQFEMQKKQSTLEIFRQFRTK